MHDDKCTMSDRLEFEVLKREKYIGYIKYIRYLTGLVRSLIQALF
jgi:hypothetical protein